MQTQRPIHQREQELEKISAWLVNKLTSYTDIAASDVDVYESFASYGLSSTDAVSLSGELEEWLGRKLPPTLLYSYPTINLLAHALVDPASTAHLPEKLPLKRHITTTYDIAVIGM